MRHLTAAGAAAVLLAAGIGAAPSAAADPTMTDPTNTEVSTSAPAEPTSTEPNSTESTDPEPTSTEPTSTEPTDPEPTDPKPTSAEPEGARQVTYTVTTTSDLTANIYYVTADPPAQSEANDPEYMPMARTMVGPGAPWTFQTTLEDPTQWAFVSASGGLRVNPEFSCEIAVDGQVVVSQQGGSGVQCALRPW
ncbi:MAG: hypothetical protein WAP49_04405 [Mycobacterium sp.]